jgi:hypothetical protein
MSKEIADLIGRLKNIDEGFESLVIESAKAKEVEIVQMNTEQLNDGQRADDKPVTPSYAQRTITRKRRTGQPFNRVTLRDKGDFHDSFLVEFKETEFELKASDPKAEFLTPKYTPNIYGLNEANMQKLREQLTPILKQKIIEKLSK